MLYQCCIENVITLSLYSYRTLNYKHQCRIILILSEMLWTATTQNQFVSLKATMQSWKRVNQFWQICAFCTKTYSLSNLKKLPIWDEKIKNLAGRRVLHVCNDYNYNKCNKDISQLYMHHGTRIEQDLYYYVVKWIILLYSGRKKKHGYRITKGGLPWRCIQNIYHLLLMVWHLQKHRC